MKFSAIILTLSLGLVSCNEESQQESSASASSNAPMDAGFDNLSQPGTGDLSPCMGGPLPIDGAPLPIDGAENVTIPGQVGGSQDESLAIPGNDGWTSINLNGDCPSASLEETDAPYVYELDIEKRLKECTDSGQLFNVESGKCTSTKLASFECTREAIKSDSFKEVSESFKPTLINELDTYYKDLQLYACTKSPSGDLTFYFFIRVNNTEIAWDYLHLKF